MRRTNEMTAWIIMHGIYPEFPKKGWHQTDVLEYVAAELLGIRKEEVLEWYHQTQEGMKYATDK